MENFIYLVGVFILVDVVFAYYIFLRKRKISKSDILFIRKQIRKSKEQGTPGEIIMEMDKIVDNTLFRYGYSGSFAEKIRRAKKLFSDYNGVWSAHKLRNKVAHEVGYRVSKDELRRALRQYDRAFRDLGIL